MRNLSSRLVVRRLAGAKPAIGIWWMVLAALAGIAVPLLMYPLATLSALAGFGVLIRCDLARHANKVAGGLSLLAARRQGRSICHFAREFDCRATDPWVVRAVYETLQDELGAYRAGFPLSAGDRLVADLFIDHEDLDLAIVPGIAHRSLRSLENLEQNPRHGQVVTVGDLVRFFQAQPQVDSPNGLLCTPANG